MYINVVKEKYGANTPIAIPYCSEHNSIADYTIMIDDAIVYLCQKCLDNLYLALKVHASKNMHKTKESIGRNGNETI